MNSAQVYPLGMPEVPEVEITARRLDRALRGETVSSAMAPGMNVMKTFEPPLQALEGLAVTGVGRIGKMPVVELGDLALLIHLMSAGRLQVFGKRASLRDRASRLLVGLGDGRELRLREFGTKQRAWAKLLAVAEVQEDEMVATLGPEAWPAPPLDDFAELIDQPRHLHPLLRDQRKPKQHHRIRKVSHINWHGHASNQPVIGKKQDRNDRLLVQDSENLMHLQHEVLLFRHRI